MNRSPVGLIQSLRSIGDTAPEHSHNRAPVPAAARVPLSRSISLTQTSLGVGRSVVSTLSSSQLRFSETGRRTLPHRCLENDARLISGGLLLRLLLLVLRIAHLKTLVVVRWHPVVILAKRRKLCRRSEVIGAEREPRARPKRHRRVLAASRAGARHALHSKAKLLGTVRRVASSRFCERGLLARHDLHLRRTAHATTVRSGQKPILRDPSYSSRAPASRWQVTKRAAGAEARKGDLLDAVCGKHLSFARPASDAQRPS